MTLEALPHMTMPHESQLPSMTCIKQRLDDTMTEIKLYCDRHHRNSPPFLVTIARSTSDGFCPQVLVEQILDELLARLHLHFCDSECHNMDDKYENDCSYCKLLIVRDYGEWEGSSLEQE